MAYRFGNLEDACALSETLRSLGEEQDPLILQDLTYHCLLPLAHLALRDLQEMGLPLGPSSRLFAECALGFHRDLVRTTIIEHQLRSLLERCSNEGLRPLPLKGNYLAARIYSRREARPYRDIDLMVRRSEVEAAVRILEKEGFRPQRGGPEFMPPPHSTCFRRELEGGRLKVDVDLHLSIHWPREYDRRTRFEPEDIWSCSREDQLWGLPITSMSPEHLVIFLCLDLAANHRFARLITLRDLLESLSAERVDFAELARWCRRWEVQSLVHPALRLLAGVAPRDTVPTGALEELRPRYPLYRAYELMLSPRRLSSMRSRSLTPRNLIFFLLADKPSQRASGLARIPGHLYSRLRHP